MEKILRKFYAVFKIRPLVAGPVLLSSTRCFFTSSGYDRCRWANHCLCLR